MQPEYGRCFLSLLLFKENAGILNSSLFFMSVGRILWPRGWNSPAGFREHACSEMIKAAEVLRAHGDKLQLHFVSALEKEYES